MMSATTKANKSSAETKSKAKSVISTLERIGGATNPDKEQTRYLCQKLLQIVNNKESSKKDVTSKSGLEVILVTLESCQDHSTCMALVNTLAEIANEGSIKRLVAQDTTRVLLHTMAYLGSDTDWRLLSCILALLSKLGPKDRRFTLRARLTGSLPMILSAVRSAHTHHSRAKMMPSALAVLKLSVNNSTSNSILLGRAGAVNVLSRVVLSLGRKQPALLKNALAVLNLLVRSSRTNSSRAVSIGLVPSILSLHCEYHKQDLRQNRNSPIRKSYLNILKNIAALKIGRKAFNEANGLKIMYSTCRDYLAASHTNTKSVDPLLNVAIMIIRRCQPKLRLPVVTSRSTIKFQLPGMQEPEVLDEDEFYVVSDEDDQDEDPDVGEPTTDADPSTNTISKSSSATSDIGKEYQPSHPRTDLKSYEGFFPELLDVKPQDPTPTKRPHTSGDIGGSPYRPLNPTRHSAPDLTHIPKNMNPWEIPYDVTTNLEKVKVADDNQPLCCNGVSIPHNSGENGGAKQAKSWSLYYDPSSTNGKPYNLPHVSTNAFHEVFKSFDADQDHNEYYESARKLAESTISVKEVVNKLSMADEIGNMEVMKPEYQLMKKNVQRLIKSKLLDDLARSLFPDDVIDDIIYSCDDITPQSYDKHNIVKHENVDIQSCDIHHAQGHRVDGNNHENQQESKIQIQVTIPDNRVSENSDDVSTMTLSDETWPGVYMENDKSSEMNGDSGLLNATECDAPRPHVTRSTLKFDSKFESGNLRTAVQVREYEYDLVLNSDCNSYHHHQWFYFVVSGMKVGQSYRFNIINCEKKGSLINEGMQPVMYSMVEAKQGSPCWRRVGHDTCYYRNHFLRSRTSPSAGRNRTHFTLSFTTIFQHMDDVCYFAYHYPYTYTQLKVDLHNMISRVDPSTMYVREQSLCNTLSGNPVPMLTITAMPRGEGGVEELRSRPYIFLTARVHPGESNASWTMRGTLRLLLTPPASVEQSDRSPASKEQWDGSLASMAEELRRSYIFKIIPMLNPDGVINGHHRCSLSGEDLNRTWSDPDPDIFPTIYHTKGLLQYLQSIKKAPLLYCDYHGHSRRMNVFMYGCSYKESAAAGETSTTVGGPDDTGFKTLPKLLNHVAPLFSLKGSSFVVEKSKVTTARVVVWREIGVTRSYTMESTYCGCDQGRYRGLQIGTKELEEMGGRFGQALMHLKARFNTRGLPVFEVEDETQIDPCEAEGARISPSCPANSDAELTPDEDDLSPIDTSLFSHGLVHDGYPAYMVEHRRMCTDPLQDTAFWRYEPNTSVNQASTSAYMVDTSGYNPPEPQKPGKVITARVSPDTGRLLYYEYSDLPINGVEDNFGNTGLENKFDNTGGENNIGNTGVDNCSGNTEIKTNDAQNDLDNTDLENGLVTTAPRPFESGLTLVRRNSDLEELDKSSRARRRSQRH